MGITTVRFCSPIPRHTPNLEDSAHIDVEKLAGTLVRIMLPPRPADKLWGCDTELQWQVHKDDAMRIGNYPNIVLCAHQIELD